jgi:hypothetical protein
MRRFGSFFRLGFIVCAMAALAAATQPSGPAVSIEDVERFYKVYDAAQGHPTADQLQRDYLDLGTEGLHSFAKARNVTAARIADAIAQQPQVYADAKRCLTVLPRVRARLQTVLQRLGGLYPEMRPAPVAIVVGRGRPVAIADPAGGVRIGLEALCAADGLDPDPEERFVQVIAHEYAHVQQSLFLNDEKNTTVLQTALAEGGAEFTAELISGKVSNARLMTLAKGRELQIETAFVPDQDETDLSTWFYNHPGTPEWPPDLGYWVGYRIVKAHYQRASDKRLALEQMFGITDAKAFLAQSGWRPGMRLD